ALADSADSPRYIETLPRQGYRFLAEISVIEAHPNGDAHVHQDDRADAVAGVDQEEAAPAAGRRRHYRWVLAAAVIAILLLSSAAVVRTVWRRPPIDSLAVLPLVNASKSPDLDYLSDGIAESVISNLSQISSLRVVSREAAFRYKGRAVDPEQVARGLGLRAGL